MEQFKEVIRGCSAAYVPRQQGRSWRTAIKPSGVYFLGAIFFGAMAAVTPVAAHSWYDPECCGGEDCEMIPGANITFLDDGNIRMRDAKGVEWLVVVDDLSAMPREQLPRTWEHPDAVYDAWSALRRVEENGMLQGPFKRASPDGEHHLCIHKGTVHCVYFPAGR